MKIEFNLKVDTLHGVKFTPYSVEWNDIEDFINSHAGEFMKFIVEKDKEKI